MFGVPGVRPEDVPLWYGVIFMVNMQMAFLSPPFGYSLFYLKSVAPPEITMATIFRAAVNFMVLQWTGRRPLHHLPANCRLAAGPHLHAIVDWDRRACGPGCECRKHFAEITAAGRRTIHP